MSYRTYVNTIDSKELESDRESLLSELEDLIAAIPEDTDDEDYLPAAEDLVKWLDVDEAQHIEFIGGQVWLDGWDECLRYALSDDARKLAQLCSLRDEVYGWDDGVSLIPEEDFEDFARERAEEMGCETDRWPYDCIDWGDAAESLAKDYSSVEYDGDTYLYRS